MDIILIVVIALLVAYPLSIFTLNNMFKQRFAKKKAIIWNCLILAVPFIGALAYWLFRLFGAKKKEGPTNG